MNTSQNMGARRHRWFWALVILVVIGAGGLTGYRSFVTRRVEAQLESIRQTRLPATSKELDRWYEAVSDQENAALKIMEAADRLSASGAQAGKLDWPERGARLSPDLRPSFEEVWTNNLQALEILQQGVQLPKCRYFTDLSQGPGTLLPHLAKIKSLAQLLRVAAVAAAELGRPDQAVRLIHDGLNLARSLEMEPVLISQLVRLACLNLTCNSLERVLDGHSLSDEQLRELAATLSQAEAQSQKAFGRSLAGERCLGSYVFEMPVQKSAQAMGDSVQEADVVLQYGLMLIGVRDQDFLFYLRTMDEWIRISESPFPDSLTKARELAGRLERELRANRLFLLSRMLLPSLGGAAEKLAEGNARLRCGQLALAVERYRSKNDGRLPQTLNHLVPTFISQVPSDPCDGRPLRFKHLDQGYVVYSVGRDGADDGGADPPKKSSASTPCDVTFAVLR